VDDFYTKLLSNSDDLPHVFRNSDLEKQKAKLLVGLKQTVELFSDPAQLNSYLIELGTRHITYEVTDKHYTIVKDILASVLNERSKDIEPEIDWSDVTETICENMKLGSLRQLQSS
jgi:hemoglobin-like flavoprotein